MKTSTYPTFLNEPLHRLTWRFIYGPIPKDHVIHHIDGNPKNNNITNLACVSKSDHRRIHAGWFLNGNGVWWPKCIHCGLVKNPTHFNPCKDRSNNTRNICKDCQVIISKDYYEHNKSRYAAKYKARKNSIIKSQLNSLYLLTA